jgi:thiol:disulfide interchange protein DsbD
MHVANRAPRLLATLFSLLLMVAAVSAMAAPPNKVKWSARLEPADARAGESAQVVVTATVEPGFHIYSLKPNTVGVATSVKLEKSAALTPQGKPVEPAAHRIKDETLKVEYDVFEGTVAFGIPVKLAPKAAGAQKAVVTAQSQACHDQICDPPATEKVAVAFKVAPGAARKDRLKPVTVAPKQVAQAAPAHPSGEDGSQAPPPPPFPPGGGTVQGPPVTGITGITSGGLLNFMWLSIAAGFAALLTPCVFPMIPITVSFFAKRKQEGSVSPVAGATAYCFGIMATFVGLGLLVSVLFGATGIQSFAANPWVNLGLGVLFVVLALNLFGVFEIQLPSSLVNSAHSGTRKGGLLGPMLMGLTFTLTSFTCTVPFVGTLLASAAQGGGIFYPVVGMLGFSAAFALPFFLLALFPQYLARMPKSGGWLVSVKAFMGFLEIAAAIKFFSNADIVWQLELLTRPVFLALWAAIFAMAAFYLLGWIRLPHDAEGLKIGWPRRAFGVLTGVGAAYMLAGMNGVSLGEAEAFPPPPTYGKGAAVVAHGAIPWQLDYEKALTMARAENKPVFVNFTGVTCVNCRAMEANVLPAPDVRKELDHFVPVELYTDRPTPEDRGNQQILLKLANTTANPTYAVVTPDGKLIKALEGRRTVAEFAAFLQEARAAHQQVAQR